MCGILGFYNFREKDFTSTSKAFHVLMHESYSRGKEASGIVLKDQKNTVHLIKSDLDGRELFKTSEYKKFTEATSKQNIISAIAHSRIATHGSQLLQANNQPVITEDSSLVAVHNGIITNPNYLWQKIGRKEPLPELDTVAFIEYYKYLLKITSRSQALAQLYSDIEGAASLAVLDIIDNSLALATNTGSLYYVLADNTLYFSSEKIFINKILGIIGVSIATVKQVSPRTALLIENGNLKLIDLIAGVQPTLDYKKYLSGDEYQLKFIDHSPLEIKSKAKNLYIVKNCLEKLKTHNFDYAGIYNIKRCTKCILPATTPFIKFDKSGVCNYCNDHKPIKQKGLDKLKIIADKYRKGNGEPDCLAAFSGGKDSSYGLHFLKKELGLQPLAYTYDWGMVTDIARRNQARVLGKLGIEHIVVSADITEKRKHIQQNILAWLKDPHPGMVTLFMQGDKQCEFYADRLKKKYNIDLMFYFRGNELEIEEFKTGHCGVKDADPGGVIHHIEAWKKVKLLAFYARKYFKNPSYFNSSFLDTCLAFYTTYIQRHHYVFLWHYIPWREKEIINTLTKEYNFELPKDTIQTWRTDDGTSAFYNYIYYHVQGFTENDSFRSRQIREGLLDRTTAIQIVNEENKPRHEALKWYFDAVGLDGDHVLGIIDKIKKLY